MGNKFHPLRKKNISARLMSRVRTGRKENFGKTFSVKPPTDELNFRSALARSRHFAIEDSKSVKRTAIFYPHIHKESLLLRNGGTLMELSTHNTTS